MTMNFRAFPTNACGISLPSAEVPISSHHI
jgi:hypothetical protein